MPEKGWKVRPSREGLTIIYTGNGKGKTTAALGQALRAAGHDFKVCVIQFIKDGKAVSGEAEFLDRFPAGIGLHVTGSGFTWQRDDQETRRAAESGWALALEKTMTGEYDLVILDELTYLVSYNLLEESRVIDLINERPSHVHLLITGRDATAGLIEAADLVTEMREVKHPYQKGIKAQKGIEF